MDQKTGPPNPRRDLSLLLGLPVLSVHRTMPAHLDRVHRVYGGDLPGTWDKGEFTARPERWWVKFLCPDGNERTWNPRSQDIRGRGREVTRQIHVFGSKAKLDNAGCRVVLRLMHEILEERSDSL